MEPAISPLSSAAKSDVSGFAACKEIAISKRNNDFPSAAAQALIKCPFPSLTLPRKLGKGQAAISGKAEFFKSSSASFRAADASFLPSRKPAGAGAVSRRARQRHGRPWAAQCKVLYLHATFIRNQMLDQEF
jgi:hypothetical protein